MPKYKYRIYVHGVLYKKFVHKKDALMKSIQMNIESVECSLWQYGKKEGKHQWREIDPYKFCLYCGKPLTDPESIRIGVGPICRKYTKKVKYGRNNIIENKKIKQELQFDRL